MYQKVSILKQVLNAGLKPVPSQYKHYEKQQIAVYRRRQEEFLYELIRVRYTHPSGQRFESYQMLMNPVLTHPYLTCVSVDGDYELWRDTSRQKSQSINLYRPNRIAEYNRCPQRYEFVRPGQ